jgi:hypothetical protein
MVEALVRGRAAQGLAELIEKHGQPLRHVTLSSQRVRSLSDPRANSRKNVVAVPRK